MPLAARSLDPIECTEHPIPDSPVSGTIAPRVPTVNIGFMPAARQSDKVICVEGGQGVILRGEPSVRIEGQPAARMGDPIAHGEVPSGIVEIGCPTVFIGSQNQVDALTFASAAGSPFCEVYEGAAAEALSVAPAPPPPYTGAETRLLMSFAMKSGGHLFSQWLRNELMKSLGYYSPNAVYLDTVASRERETEHSLTMPDVKRDGVTYVAPDTRNVKAEGFTTIGAMNSEWNEAYTKAMSEANVMLILLTPDYLASEWCMKEWQQYQDENARRAAAGRPPLHGLVVGFGSDDEATRFAGGKAETMTMPRIETTGGHHTALGPGGRGSAISEASYQQLLGWIRARSA